MASTMFNCPSCGIGYNGGCCPTCAPAQSIYQGECQDPGTQTVGRFLPVLDYKFCHGRLATGAGFLVGNINGSGNAAFSWTTTPQVELMDYAATEDIAFGQLIVMGSDFRWRALTPPATLGLFMQTDAVGNLVLGDPPAATVPDPLVINDLNVANTATINNLTTNGIVTHNNISNGTVVNLLGLDASNVMVTQALAAGIASSMFYESATSPNGGVPPNKTKTNGQYLVIGNRLFDSGANLIGVTTSEAITVNISGKYFLAWSGEVRTAGKPGIWLEINGVIVNWGNGRTDSEVTAPASAQLAPLAGFEMRSLAVGDVIKLQLSSTAASPATFEVRLIALKFADA